MSKVYETTKPKLVNGLDGPEWKLDDNSRVYGPPMFSLKFYNSFPYIDGSFGVIHSHRPCTLDRALRSIHEDIEDGLYTVNSITATQYEMVVVVSSKACSQDLFDARKKRYDALHEHLEKVEVTTERPSIST